MAGSQDMFDAIVMADERFHGEGYQEGYEEGSSLGLIEGRQHGTLHGARIGSEIGCYQGFAFAWRCLLHGCATEKDRHGTFRGAHYSANDYTSRPPPRLGRPRDQVPAGGCEWKGCGKHLGRGLERRSTWQSCRLCESLTHEGQWLFSVPTMDKWNLKLKT
ncbi:protein LTO1 homolog isoform X2 [Mustela nigripes]|uniref:protein LTO1 homolog isoform X2 n=1 Tax=Mustela nigripes TaxID=77151 RepID=UPI0028150A03|nr:protein LTO1 homolog isoform X2 [Mustela nigripes]